MQYLRSMIVLATLILVIKHTAFISDLISIRILRATIFIDVILAMETTSRPPNQKIRSMRRNQGDELTVSSSCLLNVFILSDHDPVMNKCGVMMFASTREYKMPFDRKLDIIDHTTVKLTLVKLILQQGHLRVFFYIQSCTACVIANRTSTLTTYYKHNHIHNPEKR